MGLQSKKHYKNELENRIMPFWRNLIDKEYGGFYGLVDSDLQIHKNNNKSTIGTARILWGLSRAYGQTKNNKDLEGATHAYNYLREALYDRVNGGYINEVTYKGGLHSTTKHTIFQAYVIYGMSEYYKITEDEEVLKNVIELYEMVESQLYIEGEQRYVETADAKWLPMDIQIGDRDDLEFDRTGVCYLHILEAYTNLYKVWKNSFLKARIQWLLELFRDKIYVEKDRSYGIYFDADWNLLIESYCYGRDIEATWLIHEAAETIDYQDAKLTEQLLEVIDQVYKVALLEDGTFFISIENGVPNKKLWWYAYNEAIVGFYNAYTMTGNQKYSEASKRLWQKANEVFIDKRDGGEWLPTVDENGLMEPDEPIAHGWKTPYHTARMCVEMMERLG